MRAAYGGSIEYSLEALVSFVLTHGDDDLVLVMLGDHQPATIVSGADAGFDVPVAVVARDPAVLDGIAGWGWGEGLRPATGRPGVADGRVPGPVPRGVRPGRPHWTPCLRARVEPVPPRARIPGRRDACPRTRSR